MMKLTPEQIDHIKTFIIKQGFIYPDVQLEIIDHVASRVEELMTERPELNIDHAIAQVHAEFGPVGFKVFERAMRTALLMQQFRWFKSALIDLFRFKYLPLMVIFVYLVDSCYRIIPVHKYFFVGVDTLFTTIYVTYMFGMAVKYNKYDKMLMSRMGLIYSLVINIMLQLWSFAGIFKVYQNINSNLAGVVFGSLFLAMVMAFIAVISVNKAVSSNCIDLNEKYHLV